MKDMDQAIVKKVDFSLKYLAILGMPWNVDTKARSINASFNFLDDIIENKIQVKFFIFYFNITY